VISHYQIGVENQVIPHLLESFWNPKGLGLIKPFYRIFLTGLEGAILGKGIKFQTFGGENLTLEKPLGPLYFGQKANNPSLSFL